MVSRQSKPSINAVRLTLEILEQLAAEGETGVSDLAARLRSTKGTVYRHLQTLVTHGYVTQNQGNERYGLGLGTYLLGQAAGSSSDLLKATAEPMKLIVEETGLTAVMSVVSSEGVTVLRTELGKSPVEIGIRLGSSLALHASSHGKVALAMVPGLLARIRAKPLARFTPFTLVKWTALEKEVAQVKARGWSIGAEELLLGINGIAAPVVHASGTCVATLAAVGSSHSISREPDPAQVRAVVKAARLASQNLGRRG